MRKHWINNIEYSRTIKKWMKFLSMELENKVIIRTVHFSLSSSRWPNLKKPLRWLPDSSKSTEVWLLINSLIWILWKQCHTHPVGPHLRRWQRKGAWSSPNWEHFAHNLGIWPPLGDSKEKQYSKQWLFLLTSDHIGCVPLFFGHFQYLLALPQQLVKAGNLKTTLTGVDLQSWCESRHLCGLSLSATVQLRYFRVQIGIGETEEAMAAADTGLHSWSAGHRKKPEDGILRQRWSHLLP